MTKTQRRTKWKAGLVIAMAALFLVVLLAVSLSFGQTTQTAHIARIFVGSDNKILIPAAGLMGAGLMLLADCIVQVVAETMPVGIITSIVGGPIFMILILRQKKDVW